MQNHILRWQMKLLDAKASLWFSLASFRRDKCSHTTHTNTYPPLTMKDSKIAICSSPYGVDTRERCDKKLRTLNTGACKTAVENSKNIKKKTQHLEVRMNEAVGKHWVSQLSLWLQSNSPYILSHSLLLGQAYQADFFWWQRKYMQQSPFKTVWLNRQVIALLVTRRMSCSLQIQPH